MSWQIGKAEALKEEFLRDPSVAELSTSLWETTRGAIVAYSNEVKVGQAGVPPELIEIHGAVSQEVAEALSTFSAEAHRPVNKASM